MSAIFSTRFEAWPATRVWICAVEFARERFGFARLWVEHFLLFGSLLWLFCRCCFDKDFPKSREPEYLSARKSIIDILLGPSPRFGRSGFVLCSQFVLVCLGHYPKVSQPNPPHCFMTLNRALFTGPETEKNRFYIISWFYGNSSYSLAIRVLSPHTAALREVLKATRVSTCLHVLAVISRPHHVPPWPLPAMRSCRHCP